MHYPVHTRRYAALKLAWDVGYMDVDLRPRERASKPGHVLDSACGVPLQLVLTIWDTGDVGFVVLPGAFEGVDSEVR